MNRTEIACGCGCDRFMALSHPDENRVGIVCPNCNAVMWVITRD